MAGNATTAGRVYRFAFGPTSFGVQLLVGLLRQAPRVEAGAGTETTLPGTTLNHLDPLSGESRRPRLGGPGYGGRACACPPLPTPVVRLNIRVSDAAGPYSCGILVVEAV